MTEQSPPIKPPPGFRVLLEGPAGTGKTTACRTLVAAGLTPFFVFTEPSMNMVGDIPCPKLHYTYSGQESIGWGAMIKNAKNIAFIQNEDLQKAGRTGVGLNTWVSFLEHFTVRIRPDRARVPSSLPARRAPVSPAPCLPISSARARSSRPWRARSAGRCG